MKQGIENQKYNGGWKRRKRGTEREARLGSDCENEDVVRVRRVISVKHIFFSGFITASSPILVRNQFNFLTTTPIRYSMGNFAFRRIYYKREI